MFGYRTTLQVRRMALMPVTCYCTYRLFYSVGRPLIAVDALLVPDRAGVKLGIFGWIKFIVGTIPSIPAFVHSRPTVADARISKVQLPSKTIPSFNNYSNASSLKRSKRRRNTRKSVLWGVYFTLKFEDNELTRRGKVLLWRLRRYSPGSY